MGIPEEETKGQKIFKEMMADNAPDLMKNSLYIQEAWENTSEANPATYKTDYNP